MDTDALLTNDGNIKAVKVNLCPYRPEVPGLELRASRHSPLPMAYPHKPVECTRRMVVTFE